MCPTLATPWTAACQASLTTTNSRSLLKLISIESVMPSNHLIFCHPLLPPSIFTSIRVFSNESDLCIRWPKYWSFSFCISPSSEYSGLISFRVDPLDLFAVQETARNVNIKAKNIKFQIMHIKINVSRFLKKSFLSDHCFLITYRFLRRQVRWSSIPISKIFYSLL